MATPNDMPMRLPSMAVVEVAPKLDFYGKYTGHIKMRNSEQNSAQLSIPVETFANFLDDVREGVYDWILDIPLPELRP